MIGRYAGPRPHEDWNQMNDACHRHPSRRTVREIERAMNVVPVPREPATARLVRSIASAVRRLSNWRRFDTTGQWVDDLAAVLVVLVIGMAIGYAFVTGVTR